MNVEQRGGHYLSYFIPHAGRADADAHRGRLGARRWERGRRRARLRGPGTAGGGGRGSTNYKNTATRALSRGQRIALEAPRSFGNERQRIYFESDVPISDTWTITYAGQTSAALSWDASEDQVRQALELLPGIGRVDVVRMNAGTRGFAWTVEFLDEAASYHADMSEITDAPTFETAAPATAPSQQPTISGRTDFRRPLLTVASSATIVVKRVRPRVATPDGQFWLSLEGFEGRAGPLDAKLTDDLEAAI